MKVVPTASIRELFKPRALAKKGNLTANLRKLEAGQSLVIDRKDLSAKKPYAAVSSSLAYFRKRYGNPNVKYQVTTLTNGEIAVNCIKK